MKEYPFKQLPGLDNIEVEAGETILLPGGETYKVSGRSHARGGEDIFAPNGTRVFSKRLRLPKEVGKELVGKDSKMTPAELSRRFDVTKYYDIINSNDVRYGDLEKKTAALMASKNAAMQEVIFQAQEALKNEDQPKTMKKGGMVRRYAPGGLFGEPPDGMSMLPPVSVDMPEGFSPADVTYNNAYTTVGYSMPDPNFPDRFMRSYFNPLANHPFFTNEVYKQRGELTGQARQDLESYQRALSYPEQELGLTGPALQQFQQQLALNLRESERTNPDQFIRKEVIIGDQRIPLSQATDEQINNPESRFEYTNLRTGEKNLIDGRQGNFGEATTNQNFYPSIETIYKTPEFAAESAAMTTRLPTRFPQAPTRPLDFEPTTGKTSLAGGEKNRPNQPTYIDPEKLLGGLQQGLDLANLAGLRSRNPYYAYTPVNYSTQRFDPVNQLSNDRAFNAAKEAIENSSLPEPVKVAQLNQLQASLQEGNNRVDLTNYQQNLQTQNQNTARFDMGINNNRQQREASNLRYMQDLSRARYIEGQQRQVYIDDLFERMRTRLENRQRLGLVNQLSRNYQFNPVTGQVEYQQRQGVPNTFSNLAAFNTTTNDS